MKRKIAAFTAVVMMVILCILDVFIYFTLQRHLVNLNTVSMSNNTVAAADYIQRNLSDGGSLRAITDYRWLNRFLREGQEIYVLGPDGSVRGHSGDNLLPSNKPVASVESGFQEGRVQLHGKELYYTVTPVIDDDTQRIIGYVELIADTQSQREYMAVLVVVLTIGSIGAILLTALGGYVISAAAIRPLKRMMITVGRIEAHRLHERVPRPRQRDEVALLTDAFNRMLSRIERSFEQQSQFVADASHEIRTPLTVIQGYANLLARWGKSDPKVLDQAITVIQKESSRLRQLADDLLTLAGMEASANDEEHVVDVDEVMSEVIETLGPLYPERKIQSFLAGTEAAMSPSHFRRLCTNLLDNALKYTQVGQNVNVRTSVGNGTVILEVEDSGPGIPPESLDHIFERFYRVESSRDRREGGTGLGLAIVKELVQLYKGNIEVHSQVGAGTTFSVRLPRVL
ncbi:HAMP domain-containing protein [Alicyclobacillus curvatus]|nr:HAMP domain-containing protein [Alicyclobacillus curvatus]